MALLFLKIGQSWKGFQRIIVI